jgi:PIN domain nuclease of toxin-antitoxin system
MFTLSLGVGRIDDLAVMPDTRDLFDRLLLAQCQVENMLLVATDRTLAARPLAWRER